MNIKNDEIYSFKLASGEEIVARLVSQEPDHLLIDHPISAVLSPQGLQLMPGIFTANLDKNVRLNNSSWAMIAETREDLRASWIQATTGIAPVSKQIITG